jgi:hypothetical protein
MRAPLLLLALFLPPAAPGGNAPSDYPITPVPFTAVEFTDGFWSRRIDVNRNVTLPHNFVECENTGRIDNFVFAAGLKQGKHTGYQFNDSDIYKVIEGASYSLLAHPDTDLVRTIDSIIVFIAAAQEPDGYLYTPRRLITPDYAPPGGKERWVGMKDGSHELYTVGHLYEAAAAHFAATGKRSLLTVALRSADLICSTFGPGKRGEVPDHQEIEIGLCKLYRVTGDEKYLRTAKWFLDQRGNAKDMTSWGNTHRMTGRSSIRRGRKDTPSAPRICTLGWPTSRRSGGTTRTSLRSSVSGVMSSTGSSMSRGGSGRLAGARGSARHIRSPTFPPTARHAHRLPSPSGARECSS